MKSTICFVLLLTVAAVFGQRPSDAKMRAFFTSCVQSLKVSDADRSIVMSRKPPTTTGSSCLYACIRKKTGWMAPDNSLNVEVAKMEVAPMQEKSSEMYTKMISIIDSCKAAEGTPNTDECVAIQKLMTCVANGKAAAGIK